MRALMFLAAVVGIGLSVWVIITYRRYAFPVIAAWLVVIAAIVAVNAFELATR